MDDFTTRLYAVAQVRELERRAIASGISGYALMQRAALACWREMQKRWPDARRVHVICGSGNNGGDGYEIARLARAAGHEVRLLQVGTPPATDEGGAAHQAWLGDGGAVEKFAPESLERAELLVDALFGIGLARDLDPAALDVVRAINARCVPVISVDVPSGLDADRGCARGDAVRSHLCVSFIAHKIGLHTGAARDYRVECVLDGLNLADEIYAGVPAAGTVVSAPELIHALPRRRRSSHKGAHGHVALIGGNDGMAGAILLAGRAALRSGAGLVSIATRAAHASAICGAQPELMVRGCEDAAALRSLLARADIAAIGPGLGQDSWARSVLSAVLESKLPLVLDADALNLLSQNPSMRADWVLTPHPGEAARLLGIDTGQVERDRCVAVQNLRRRYGGVIVLKGAGTLVQGERLGLCTEGNPGMGVGGMGDVLTGVIVALMAQGLSAEVAARTGVLAHARAGDLAAQGGERGLLPGDVIDRLRIVLNP